MSEIHLEAIAYTKFILHAAKYPYCAVNGLLIAENNGKGNKDGLVIVDSVPLFHHSHNLAPMPEIALTKIDAEIQKNNRIIVGYYAACENFYDNSPERCPSQKIAEKIVEFFPKAVFLVIDNSKFLSLSYMQKNEALHAYRYFENKWKRMENECLIFEIPEEVMLYLLSPDLGKMIVDFDNYLDDMTLDWSNIETEKFVKSILNKKKTTKNSKAQCNTLEQIDNNYVVDDDTSQESSE